MQGRPEKGFVKSGFHAYKTATDTCDSIELAISYLNNV